MRRILLTLAAAASLASAKGLPAGNRITLPTTGKQIFVSGMNLAWINYASDVVSFDSATMASAMKAVHDSGGNTMRIWLSTNGAHDPVFDANGYVSGPAPNTVANIQKMLRIAKSNDLVLILSLMSHNWMSTSQGNNVANNYKMLSTDSGISAYVKNYVVPVVTQIGADPNILCWEVFNEPEGMVQGWSGLQAGVTMHNVQTVVNRVAGAIHRNVPAVLVSNGAVTTDYTSNAQGTNDYTDSALEAAGGDTLGYLDFYMAHYYSSNGSSPSPFTKTCAYWKLDKPLVIGEYPSQLFSSDYADFGGQTSVDSLLMYLDNNGYAGGLGWMYYANAGMAGYSSFSHSMGLEYRYDSTNVKLTGQSDNKFTVGASAGAGGTIVRDVTGRLTTGTKVTLVAVPSAGYTFAGWSGDTTTTNDTLVVTVGTNDLSYAATFAPGAGTNLVKGGTFTAATADSADWTFYYATSGNSASVGYSTGAAVVKIVQADTLNYDIQLSQGGFEVDSGATYVLTFDASANAVRPLALGLSSGSPAWTWLGGANASLATSTKTFTLDITALHSAPAAVLQFNLGGSTGTVTIDNVTLVKEVSSNAVRAGAPSLPTWSVVRNGSSISWTSSAPLSSDGIVRLVSASGRELAREQVPAGAATGSIQASTSGIAFLVLESAGTREIEALPLTR